ncbi:hypothetical protein SAMN05216353_12854 [Halobacillus alkaliphilus]|uniref:Uncharacterized protein n=1 Tax=Halobacillus alkaliphilus TaxID=396056 RepID=A0A1I2Q4H2_9BACI|nr:hypothetical protein [Halobacillus alkaliphilus]SFG22269.1 hypothetical protein SAMN05216353_12854 [Halobacillus alkaliphilus]
MNKNQRLTIVFLLLGSILISGGIGLRDYVSYSLPIGWIAGFISQLIAVWFAVSWYKETR